MFIGLPLPRFEKRNPGGGGPIAPPPLVAHIAGDSGGLLLPGAPLTGSLTGVGGGQTTQHRWFANGAEITGETTQTLIPVPGSNVSPEAVLRYVPLVGGVDVLSREVQLVAAPAVELAGDTAGYLLPGGTLTGIVTGGLPGQVVQPLWLANGALVPDETVPELVALPGLNVPAEAVLRYAPEIDGLPYQSRDIQLTLPVAATLTGSVNGEVLPEQALVGVVTGGLPGQTIQHRWLADGVEIADAVDAVLTPGTAGPLSASALLRYAPRVNGVEVLSDGVTLMAGIAVSISGDVAGAVLPGGMLTASVIGGLTGQDVQHRWTADGTLISGETGPVLVPMPGGNVLAGAVLRYAPLIDGDEYISDAIALVPPATAMISGAIDGFVLRDQTLTGQVSGGLADPVVQNRWLADGAEIPGATGSNLDLGQFWGITASASLRYAPLVNGVETLSEEVTLAAPVVSTLTGDTAGELLPGGTLIGDVIGGLPGQVVQSRWLADGAEIAGEIASELVAQPGVNVPNEAILRYAPRVDEVTYLSDEVQLVVAILVSVTGHNAGLILPGSVLTGGVTGGLTGQAIEHRWRADGTLISGETGPELIPVPGGNVPAEAVLRYAPLIDGVSYETEGIQLVPEIVALVSGDDNGVIEPNQPLIGAVTGGLPGQDVSPRWMANGTFIAGEVSETLIPVPGGNVPAEAALRYAPSVDGGLYLSAIVQLAADTQSQSLPRLTGTQRMGAEISLDASMLTGVSARTYFLDGVEIQGQTGPSITAPFMGALTCEVVADQGTFTTPPLHILMDHAIASHNAGDDAIVALAGHGEASHIAVVDGPWSDPNTWDIGAVPGNGALVLIPSNRVVSYDVAASPRLDRLRIDGQLGWALDRSTHLLVETIIVPPSGHMIIGDAVDNRLPAQFTAEIVISNRAYKLDPGAPTDLDLANDPTLVGRGLLALGKMTTFGHHRVHAVVTAPSALPDAGQTNVTLAEAPEGWAVGDTIIIPGTAVDIDATGLNTRYDEERVITDISGAVVSFAEPLLHAHNAHSPAVNDRPNLALPILVKNRNVIIRSEPGAAVHQRGHVMGAHMMCRLDLWDTAFLELGRTDKSKPAGVINADGDFLYIPTGEKTLLSEPVTAQSNLQSRYPIHGHFLGFKKPATDLVRDCFIEDALGWAGVHHGCEMDWLNNAFYRYQGAGLVAETGDELGRWDGNVVCGLETRVGAYRYPKGQAEKEGKTGDQARWGWNFFYRGRAMIVTRNYAIGGTWGHVFYHRGDQNGIGDFVDIKRVNADVNDLALRTNVEPDAIQYQDYPITHFDRNVSIGCAGALAVVKTAARQNHDLNIKIANFLGWACARGVGLNYIGGYLVQDVEMYDTEFDPQVSYATPVQNVAFSTGKTNQVAFDRVYANGYNIGVEFSGSDVQGIENSQFSQDDPRFILNNHTFENVTEDIAFVSGNEIPTESVTRVIDPPISTYLNAPSIALPFILADYDGTQTGFFNTQTGLKTDSVSEGGILPKPWDDMGLSYGNQTFRAVRAHAARFGLWDYGADKITLIPYYFSDRLTANSIKQMHAIRFTGDVSGYEARGAWTRSATPPVCANVTRNVTVGVEDSFNVLDNATGVPGTTLSLNIPELIGQGSAPGLGTDAPAHFKANYGKISVDKAGLVTYQAIPGSEGITDKMLVYVYDGQGRFCTVEITYTIAAA